MKTLTIDNRDLAYTIDTYGMFDGNSTEEMESQYLAEEYNLTDEQWRDLGWNYNHPGVVEHLARTSVSLIDQNVVQHNRDGIVKSVTYQSCGSPQFYNYTTDFYDAEWEIDEFKLLDWVNDNIEDFGQHLVDTWGSYINVPEQIDMDYLLDDNDKMLVAALDYYLRDYYDTEDYESSMFEFESEAWLENMTLAPESQKVIDNATRKVENEN